MQGDPFADGDLGAVTEMPAAGPGHNNPPADAKLGLQQRLATAHEALVQRATMLLAEAVKAPAEVDATTEGKVTDLVSLMKAATKELDNRRVAEKEPYLSGTRIVDAFFNGPKDRLQAAALTLERQLGRWLQVKAANERRAREERERQERAEAQRKFTEAVAAQELESAAATQAEAAAQATAAAGMDLEAAREAYQVALREHAAAKAVLDNATAAGDAKRIVEAKNRMAVASAAGTAARTRANELAEAVAVAQVREQHAQAEADAASRQAATALDVAAATESSAAKLGKQAKAPVAELSRTRGDYAQAGLRRSWTFDGFDRDTLDLEALRAHLPQDGIERALRSFIAAGGRNLRGVSIYEDTRAQVR